MNFDEYLQAYINGLGDNRLIKAMLYATSGGKHFRPELLFAVVKGFGISEDRAYPAAAALEMLHSYSLIHDEVSISYVQSDTKHFRRDLILVPAYLAKGLEFDCVILYNDRNNSYKSNERNLLYVACTRAQHELYIYN